MPLDTRQQKWLPLGLNPQDIATGASLPELGKVYAAEQQFPYLLPPFQTLLSSNDQEFCGKQVSCLKSSCAAAPEGSGSLKSSRKRFLVFDQSGNQTRLLQCGFPLQFPCMAAEQGFSKDRGIPEKILLHVENSYNCEEESEMHEDTEEINALLYSDDDCCESDDEVMSTGHSPFPVEQQACNKKATEELDEIESRSDDGPRLKRQKLLDHSYPSNISSKQETGSGLSDEQSRKDKIHTAMRILESVVPGAKGKEALLLLDEAIDYLKSLKRNLNSSNGFNNHW